jgi:hypothetical protein
MNNNIACLINGKIVNIPFEGKIIYEDDKDDVYRISGRLIFPEKSTIKESLVSLSKNAVVDEVIECIIPDAEITGATVGYSSKSEQLRVELQAAGVEFKFFKQKEDGMVIFNLKSDSIDKETIFGKIINLLCVNKMTVCYVLGKDRFYVDGLPPDDILPGTPRLFSPGSSFLYAKFDMSKSINALRSIMELFRFKDVMLYIGVKSNEWIGYIDLLPAKVESQKTKGLGITIKIGDKPSFSLDGHLDLELNNTVMSFKTSCEFTTDSINLSAGQVGGEVLELFKKIKLSQMQLSLIVGKNFTGVALRGRVSIGKINVFGAAAFGNSKTAGFMVKMGSVAISDITLQEVVETIAGIEIEGKTFLNEIGIKGIKVGGEQIISSLEDVKNDLTRWGCFFRNKVEGNTDDTGDFDFYDINDRYLITDKASMRHYAFYKSGGDCYIPQVEAQFLVALEDIELGDYKVNAGAFVCANIHLFGSEFIAFLNLKGYPSEDISITACMMISPISVKINNFELIKIEGTGREAPDIEVPGIVKSIIDSSQKDQGSNGAIFYFNAHKKGINLYLDASISILEVINVNANIQMSKELVRIDTYGMLGFLKYALRVECSYKDFTSAGFKVLLLIDTTNIKENFKKVNEKIGEAQEAIEKRIEDIEDAKNKVNNLNKEIESLSKKKAGIKYKLDAVVGIKGIFKKIKYALEIAGLDIAIAAVVCAQKIALAALDIAEAGLDLGVYGLDLVKGVLDGILKLFYIERFVISAELGSSNGFLCEVDFVLFGKQLSAHYSTNNFSVDSGEILGELDSKMANSPEEYENINMISDSSNNEFNRIELNDFADVFKNGENTTKSFDVIISKAEELYKEHIDGEIGLSEHDELKTAILKNNRVIMEYTDQVDNIGKEMQKVLDVFKEGQNGDVQQPKAMIDKIEKLDILETLLAESKKIKESLKESTDQIEKTRETGGEDYIEKGVREATKQKFDYDSFADDLMILLDEEAKKNVDSQFIIPGYEPKIKDIIDSVRTMEKKESLFYSPGKYKPKL